MPRNLDHRVECVTEVLDVDLKARLDEILDVNARDDVLAWELGPEGWSKVPTTTRFDSQRAFQRLAEERALP
jgi:polyphosphate kinase